MDRISYFVQETFWGAVAFWLAIVGANVLLAIVLGVPVGEWLSVWPF